jgi:uncharacterized peroxidase-related enzyme
MNERISYAEFSRSGADTLKALAALSKSALDRGLDKVISELVKLRVSQINGCAFCVAYHLKMLRSLQVDQAKLDTVVAWREAALFTDGEQAALAWAEELAMMNRDAPSDETKAALAAHFSSEQIVGLNISIAGINAWNRLAVAMGFSPADVT